MLGTDPSRLYGSEQLSRMAALIPFFSSRSRDAEHCGQVNELGAWRQMAWFQNVQPEMLHLTA